MPGNRYGPEQIIAMLREAEMEQAKGATVAQVCKKLGITDQTYYRWRRNGGLKRTGNALTLAGWFRSGDLASCSSWDCRILSKATGTSGGQRTPARESER